MTVLNRRDHFGRLRVAAKSGTEPVFDDAYLRGDGVVFHIYALVTSKTGANLPGVEAGFTTQVGKVPKELKGQLAKPLLVKAEEAAAAGLLWFIKVGSDKQGVGWKWKDKNGAKQVAAVQDVLSFLTQFKDHDSVKGSKALYVELNNNFLGQ